MTQRVRFGLNADPNTGGVAIAERITAVADSHGLDLVGMQDHPYNDGFLDTFTLLTWLASKTARVHFVPNAPAPRPSSNRPPSTRCPAAGSSWAWGRAR